MGVHSASWRAHRNASGYGGGIRPPGSCPRNDARADARRRIRPARKPSRASSSASTRWNVAGAAELQLQRGHSPDAIPASAPGDPRARALRECVGRLPWARTFRWGLLQSAPHAQLQGIKSRDAPAIEILEYLGDRSGAPLGREQAHRKRSIRDQHPLHLSEQLALPQDRATRLRHRTATA